MVRAVLWKPVHLGTILNLTTTRLLVGSEPAFLVFAFQEIVPLSPQMIMATDPEKK
jgi:hypothetical protein